MRAWDFLWWKASPQSGIQRSRSLQEGGYRDQICMTSGPTLDYARQVDLERVVVHRVVEYAARNQSEQGPVS